MTTHRQTLPPKLSKAAPKLLKKSMRPSVVGVAPRKPKQLSLLKGTKNAYGGDLRKTRKGRAGARPLSTRETMHLVLRSSKARGEFSFLRPKNNKAVRSIVEKFSFAYGVRVISMANVGNHLHLQIKLGNRHTYRPFIRAITGAIALAVMGRRNKAAPARSKFWDYRPFTRIVQSLPAILNLKDYIRINELEGQGDARQTARFIIEMESAFNSA